MILFQWLRNSIKNLNNRVSSQFGRRALILGEQSKIITFYPKNSCKGTFFLTNFSLNVCFMT